MLKLNLHSDFRLLVEPPLLALISAPVILSGVVSDGIRRGLSDEGRALSATSTAEVL